MRTYSPTQQEAWHQAATSLGHVRGSSLRSSVLADGRDPESVDCNPLSGEWAGESMSDIFWSITGLELDDDRNGWQSAILDTYEQAYLSAFYDN